MASTAHDDGFREIQLNGKQLVFLFMAVTVVSVVIFLCGVLVGRGVRGETTMAATEEAVAEMASGEALPPPPAAAPGASSAPATSGEVLTYAERLGEGVPASRDLRKDPEPPAPKPAAEPPAPKAAEPPPSPSRADAGAAKPAEGAPAAPAAATAPGEPSGPGFAIQVAALRERTEADAVAKRLIGKGYKAYVMAPVGNTPSVFRVRVGKFKERREADNVASRLQKEEQFKPWIVR
jgi:cell division septation protein DedD